MEQRISLITLGVADLERSVAFYERVVGWKATPGPPGVAFFDLGGIVFGLYPREDLATDMGCGANGASAGDAARFALAHNARSKADVERIFAQLEANGATIAKPPEETFWGGYSGYFRDPDGHAWEVAYNPFWTIGEDGRITMEPA